MSAWDDPISHIRELEGRLSRVRALADEWVAAERDADDYGPGAAYTGYDCADMLRDALEGR